MPTVVSVEMSLAAPSPLSASPSWHAAQKELEGALSAAASVVIGQQTAQKIIVSCLLAEGHVLLEDVPGVGKTTLARATAQALGLKSSRIQFTSDMLPGDIVGGTMPDPNMPATLSFRPGPLFAEIVVADEINRASPRTQSALLEAMAERQVTVDDTTHPLPALFLVLATQNPLEHRGTFALPESQLDRFMVSMPLGYPASVDEFALIARPEAPRAALAALTAKTSTKALLGLVEAARHVTLSDPVVAYILAIVRATREHPDVQLGASPRAALALASLARSWALVAGRDHVLPDDIQVLAPYALPHRLSLRGSSDARGRREAHGIVDHILRTVAVPR